MCRAASVNRGHPPRSAGSEERGEPYAANYFGQPAGDKILRSSTYFIRDEKRNVVGILGVNVDLTQLMAARQTVDRLLGLEKSGGVSAVPFVGESGGPRRDEADRNVEHMVYSVLERVLSACKAAPSRLTAREKRELVEELNARGVFLLKGVVTEVARRLSVSEQTVYRYLKG
ncbi:helix-turn-helix domain-containing protein [uncultured Fretibacterium sp.]|uniref:helix-turn-helix domain-containing protein n=1 Tax=uncultured Fretibacterium sp. TaxID=1678694 RepID=UPI00260ABDC2|nr:helix-turn-helix domain-containing protein [uncultured Fretibacterium sp.]